MLLVVRAVVVGRLRAQALAVVGRLAGARQEPRSHGGRPPR